MLRMALEKLSELYISLEKEAKSVLKNADKEYIGYCEKYLEKKRALEDGQASLDQAVAAVIKNNLVIIDDPVEHTEIMKGCLADLAKAKAQNSKAKADFESITSNYTASETKYNAVTSRHSAEQKIAKVRRNRI
ncbi:hypothetical protein IWW40_003293 [Coemansia sp. RSA 1250]|nr:hypothetical protein IWW40_003293 [Coemansia sp. RSA 1250]